MDRIFVVTSGHYSEYAIEAVFDSREKAEAWMRQSTPAPTGFGEFNEIEEYYLNPEPKGRTYPSAFLIIFDDANVLGSEVIDNCGGGCKIRNAGDGKTIRFEAAIPIKDELLEPDRYIKIASEKRSVALNNLNQGLFELPSNNKYLSLDYNSLLPIG